MPAALATAEPELRRRAVAMREQFVASGTGISEWARERGFSERLTHEILRGERPCLRGQSHKIAVALGIKADAPPPGRPANATEPAPPRRASLDTLKTAS